MVVLQDARDICRLLPNLWENGLRFDAVSVILVCTAPGAVFLRVIQKGRMLCARKYAGYDEGKPVEADRAVCRSGFSQSGLSAAL